MNNNNGTNITMVTILYEVDPYNSFKMAAISIQFKFYDADLFI